MVRVSVKVSENVRIRMWSAEFPGLLEEPSVGSTGGHPVMVTSLCTIPFCLGQAFGDLCLLGKAREEVGEQTRTKG